MNRGDEMMNIFSCYEQGLECLLKMLGKNHPRFAEALTLQARLLENIAQASCYGNSEGFRSERAQVIGQLNQLALMTLNNDFNSLCNIKSSLKGIEIGDHYLSRPREYIRFRTPVFVGRHTELKTLQNYLMQGNIIGLYAISGMGGIGKSSLAAELAARLDDPKQYPGGVLWANLAEETPSIVAARWLRTYGYDVSGNDSETARLNRLATILEVTPAIVILDNAQDAQIVRKLLVKTENVTVLITTRKRNTIPSEVRSIALEQLPLEDSLKLLESYIGANKVQNELEDSKEICKICGYLPLALTLAGAQLADTNRWSSVAKYRSKLEQNLIEMLSKGEYSEDNVRIAFEVSYKHIRDNNIKSLFAMLALFVSGNFCIDAVSALSDIAYEKVEIAMEQLVDLSLVLIAGEDRYRLHDLMREYAHEKLCSLPAEEINACKRRLVIYYRDYSNRFRNEPDKLDMERDNLIEVVRWVQNDLGHKGLIDDMIDIVTTLTAYFKDRGLWVEAAILGETAFVSAESKDLIEKQAELATFTLSWMYYYQEKFELSEKWARVGIKLYTKIGNNYGIGVATRRLGMISQSRGDGTNARILLNDALKIFRDLDNKSKIADTLTALGYLERKSENLDLSEKYLREALEIVESISNQKEISLTLYQLAKLYHIRGDLDTAKSFHSRSLEIDIYLNRTPGIAYNQHNLGLIEETLGNKQKAYELLVSARKIFNNMGADKRVRRIDEVIYRLSND